MAEEPNFMRVVRGIRDQIADGTLRPRDALPSHQELKTSYGVGGSAVREAILTLIAAGDIVTRPGKGRYVADPGEKPAPES